jgi:3-oxoacyl-[acyl-carrier-protein] synthase-3
VVLRRGEGATTGLLYTQTGADGSGHELLYAPGGLNHAVRQLRLSGDASAAGDDVPNDAYYLRMDGPKVFKLAVTRMAQLVLEAAEEMGWRLADVDLIIPHQANRRIIDAIGDRLGVPAEKVFANIDRFGNTSAASIPIAYDEARRGGHIRPGSRVVMVAFGAGLTWGSAVILEGKN